jgi:hypothetical protein
VNNCVSYCWRTDVSASESVLESVEIDVVAHRLIYNVEAESRCSGIGLPDGWLRDAESVGSPFPHISSALSLNFP